MRHKRQIESRGKLINPEIETSGYNAVVYKFGCNQSLQKARNRTKAFNQALRYVIHHHNGLLAICHGWWKFSEATGLPKPIPLYTCFGSIASYLGKNTLERLERLVRENQVCALPRAVNL